MLPTTGMSTKVSLHMSSPGKSATACRCIGCITNSFRTISSPPTTMKSSLLNVSGSHTKVLLVMCFLRFRSSPYLEFILLR